MSHIAGPYTATYKGSALGQFDDGFEVDYGQQVEEITSDIWPARENAVFRGVDLIIRAILNEPNAAGVDGLIWPWNATVGLVTGIGRLLTTMDGALVLTKCSGTTATPTSITIPRAIIWTDRITSRYNSRQRKIPVVIAGLPVPYPSSESAGVISCTGATLFSTT